MASKYKQAGVDIEAGTTLIDVIRAFTSATARPGTKAEIGGFGGMFDLKPLNYKDPLLVATTDSVGTKVLLAIKCNKHDTIGIDMVGMCVNDLIVQGAEPIFLLDYVGTGRLDIDVVRQLVAGVAQGCKLAGCALIGGETAEMPGVYKLDDYDLAGFAVGIVERDHYIDGSTIQAGDVILGLASDGLHSNGFSLVRKIVADQKLDYESAAPFMLDIPLGEALLAPTRIYIKQLLPLIREKRIKGMAHITGGGLKDNVPRILPTATAAHIDVGAWRLPSVFQWLASQGDIEPDEMMQTFNCGIGMVLVVDPRQSHEVQKHLKRAGEKVYEIGQVQPRTEAGAPIVFKGLSKVWLG